MLDKIKEMYDCDIIYFKDLYNIPYLAIEMEDEDCNIVNFEPIILN